MGYRQPSGEQQQHITGFLNALNDGGGADQVSAYLAAGGEVNAAIMPFIENTLLHHAAVYRRLDLIELLVSRGADPNRCDALGMTSLHTAVLHEIDAVLLKWQEADFPCARKLVRMGASLDIVDSNGRTPCDYTGAPGAPLRAALDEALMDPDD
ncbi:MAG: ankyrin repeat domain-containing protein [Hyphomonadaceae bacterium JAD_PAG50586_4]|nr:MAG: ankyrin repeat domain-containing protein [Hyphomonadaceae bacterium JAD_PAG50586_4]